MPELSKNKMRKIKSDGLFAGKNITKFDNTGKPVSAEEHNAYLQTLRGDTVIETEADAKAKQKNDDQAKHVKQIKQSLQENVEKDEQIAKDRIKEKRLKEKRRRKGPEKQDEEPVMFLGSAGASDDESDHEDQSSVQQSESSGEESSEEIVEPPTKKQKVESAEERAMRILSKSLF